MSTYKESLSHVQEAVESILRQNYNNFEFLIHVDYKENKLVLSYLKTIAAKDNRVKIFINESSQGLARCRNAGVSAATGEYIAVMDADDVAVDNRIKEQLSYLQTNKADVVFSQVEYINEAGKHFAYFLPYTKNPKRDVFLKHCFAHPTGFFKKNVLTENQYDTAYNVSADLELWLRLLSKKKIFSIIPKILLKYRIHTDESPEQRLSRQGAYAKGSFEVVKKHIAGNLSNPFFWYFTLKWIFF